MKAFLYEKPLYMLLFGLTLLFIIIGLNINVGIVIYYYNLPKILHLYITLFTCSFIGFDIILNNERFLIKLLNHKIFSLIFHYILILIILRISSLIVKYCLKNPIYHLNNFNFNLSLNSNLVIKTNIQCIGSTTIIHSTLNIDTDTSLKTLDTNYYNLCFSENPARVIKNTIDN
jgi:hypothetical protein